MRRSFKVFYQNWLEERRADNNININSLLQGEKKKADRDYYFIVPYKKLLTRFGKRSQKGQQLFSFIIHHL